VLDQERRARQPRRARRARRDGQLAQIIRHPRWSTPDE
jgi:hypothetical protein